MKCSILMVASLSVPCVLIRVLSGITATAHNPQALVSLESGGVSARLSHCASRDLCCQRIPSESDIDQNTEARKFYIPFAHIYTKLRLLAICEIKEKYEVWNR